MSNRSMPSLRLPLLLLFLTLCASLGLMLDASIVRISSEQPIDQFVNAQKELRNFAIDRQDEMLAEKINLLNKTLEDTYIINEKRFLSILYLFGFAILICGVSLLSRTKSVSSAHKRAINFLKRSVQNERSALDVIIHDVRDATGYIEEHLKRMTANPPEKKGDQTNLEFGIAETIDLAGHLKAISEELEAVHESYTNVDRLLLKLSAKCGENAHSAAATRIEWNTMGHKLRQLSEHQNKIKTLADKTVTAQSQCSEQLAKSLEFNRTYTSHSENVQNNLNQLFENTRSGYQNLDNMGNFIAESKVDVQKAAGLVQGLSERAEAIVNIIDVIDDIAEQTNQLALNASIEAARAGEQGQGFAVVAGEVRNLAARSSTATRTITELLGTIQEEAGHAAQLIEKSKQSVSLTFDNIRSVDQSYRESLILARHSVSGLDVLLRDVNNHFSELKTIEKSGQEVKKLCSKMQTVLEEQLEMGAAINSDGNQLTVYSDRIARLLTRQFHEINHSQKMLSLTDQSIIKLKNKLSSSQGNTVKVKSYFEQIFQQSLRAQSIKKTRSTDLAVNLQKLKSSANSLALIHEAESNSYVPTLKKPLAEKKTNNLEGVTLQKNDDETIDQTAV